MRRLLLLPALLALACAPLAEPGDDPLVDGADAAPPDWDPPRRSGPMPDDGAVVQQGVGSVLLTLAGEVEDVGGPVDSPGDRLELVLLDGVGAELETLEASVTLYPIPGPWRQRLWWPSDSRPAAAVVRLFRGDALTLEAAVDAIDPVPLAEGHCDPAGFADRCPAETACFAQSDALLARPGFGADARAEVGGRCLPVALTAWRHDDIMLIDARADDPAQGRLPLTGGLTAEGWARADLRDRHDAGWRNFGYVRLPPPPTVDLYVGPHLFAADTPVAAKPRRARGEGCDPARLIDTCVDGAACGPDATCRAISAPALDRLVGVTADGAVGLVFAGRDAEDDVRGLLIDVLDARGDLMQRYDGYFSWSLRPNRFGAVAFEGHVEQGDGLFEGQYTVIDARWPAAPARVRVAVQDAEGLIGETVEVDLDRPAPARRALGQACDPFELIDVCPSDAFCDRPDGAGGPMTCLSPPAGCALDLPRLDGEYRGDNAGAPDVTLGSCTNSRGNIGNEQGHVFTAERAGLHRFTVARPPEADGFGYPQSTLFARRHCDLPRADDSELACAHFTDEGQPEGGLALDVELAAGETVYVFVEAPWTGGGPYVLAVEEP